MTLHADHWCRICDTLCAYCPCETSYSGAHCMNGHEHPGDWEGRASADDPRQVRFDAQFKQDVIPPAEPARAVEDVVLP